ncbi:Crp/Fnr family transcriptional regulator [Jiella avicenniae]|uniref:Crp/Fnr family transcriptional regulator n=1 Tax=Jiella avicenniae TaxID=2907202 RepID=A0A9X1P252_9HYPH|nr:Crp/Fnr family transcriptional regulator [Jiella avicenniae]MCE7029657.1 Crp/Fnr family transcriptional regulator [Jiella avicenniae]
MANPLFRKLSDANTLNDADRDILDKVIARQRTVAARRDVISAGDRPKDVHLVIEGFACRYKLLPDGQRQIVAILVPGDFCDLHVAILGEMDHGIATLSNCTIVEIPPATVDDLTMNHPRITRSLWWATLVDEAILREWVTNLGRRPADRHIAHLMCELYLRLKAVGLVIDHTFELPLTQQELADAIGISIVHANRMLSDLRDRGLVTFQGRRVRIADFDALMAFADFDPAYLHLVPRTENGLQRDLADRGSH